MAPLSLNDRQQSLLIAVAKYAKDIDWDEVAKEAGCDKVKQAKDNWANLRKKIESSGGANDGDATPTTGGKKKATPASKKRKGANNDDDDDETPVKKNKKKTAKNKDIRSDDEEKEGEPDGLIKPDPDGEEWV